MKAICAYCRRFPQCLARYLGPSKLVPLGIHHDSSKIIQSFALRQQQKKLSTHPRQWKYDETVEEFFVEDETTVKIKKSDLTKQVDTTEMEVLRLNIYSFIYFI